MIMKTDWISLNVYFQLWTCLFLVTADFKFDFFTKFENFIKCLSFLTKPTLLWRWLEDIMLINGFKVKIK